MGLLGSIGDALGGAVDFVGDALGGGGGIGSAIGGALGSVVPGVGTALGASIGGAAGGLFGGGGGGNGGSSTGGFNPSGLFGGDEAFIQPSPVDMGPISFNPSNLGNMFQGGGGNGNVVTKPQNGMMMTGGFNQALMMELVGSSIRSSAGRAVIEAMASGSLNGGIIQPTVPVQTPRGQENHSPPGFRTVYVNSEPYAVFKPVAKCLGLLPKTSKAKITSADMKAITKADRLAKTIKRLGQKTGRLKITNK